MIFNALGLLGVPQRLLKPVAYIGGVLLVIALLGGLWLWVDAREDADDKRNQEIGATGERERGLGETLKQVEKANAAAENIERDDDARRADCLRDARNPADC